jgi:hypothetical protein
MKTFIKSATGSLLLLLFVYGSGCKKDEDPGLLVEKQILKFTDFECSNVSWQFKPGYSGVAPNYYIASSQQELEKYITINCIPQIDFSRYVVLLGQRGFPTGVSLYDEKLEENNAEIVYTVTFMTQLTLVAQPIQYYAIIELPTDNRKKSIRVEEIIKDHE